MGASIVACVDAAPILDPAEYIFDFVAPAVEDGVVWDLELAAHLRGDADGDITFGQGVTEPFRVISSVAEQDCPSSEHLAQTAA